MRCNVSLSNIANNSRLQVERFHLWRQSSDDERNVVNVRAALKTSTVTAAAARVTRASTTSGSAVAAMQAADEEYHKTTQWC
jgi:hypothetical protein